MRELDMLPVPDWGSNDDVAEWIRGDLVEWLYILWQDHEKGRKLNGALFGDVVKLVDAAAVFLIDGDKPQVRSPKPEVIEQLADLLLTIPDRDDDDGTITRAVGRAIKRASELLPALEVLA